MRELSDSFERITHIPREKSFIWLNSSKRGRKKSWGSRDAFKKHYAFILPHRNALKCFGRQMHRGDATMWNSMQYYIFWNVFPCGFSKVHLAAQCLQQLLRKSNWFTSTEIYIFGVMSIKKKDALGDLIL